MTAQLGDITTTAATQAGVFSFAQAELIGLDRRMLRRAEERGEILRSAPRVYRFSGSPASDRAAIWSAVLQFAGAGARASHESALRLHQVNRVPSAVAVTLPPGRNRNLPAVRIHQANDMIDEHCASIDGIPTTTIERAVIDVAGVFLPARLGLLIDELTIQRRMTSVGAISRALRQVDRRGRANIGRLAPLLDERRPNEPAPRSKLERLVDELIRSAKVPRPAAEHPLPSPSQFPGYVDRAWIETKLILEVDGRSWHARERAMARDRARDRAAANVGWQTLRVLDDEIDTCPDAVIRDIETTHATRASQLHLAS